MGICTIFFWYFSFHLRQQIQIPVTSHQNDEENKSYSLTKTNHLDNRQPKMSIPKAKTTSVLVVSTVVASLYLLLKPSLHKNMFNPSLLYSRWTTEDRSLSPGVVSMLRTRIWFMCKSSDFTSVLYAWLPGLNPHNLASMILYVILSVGTVEVLCTISSPAVSGLCDNEELKIYHLAFAAKRQTLVFPGQLVWHLGEKRKKFSAS